MPLLFTLILLINVNVVLSQIDIDLNSIDPRLLNQTSEEMEDWMKEHDPNKGPYYVCRKDKRTFIVKSMK
jgi:ribosomal protein S10